MRQLISTPTPLVRLPPFVLRRFGCILVLIFGLLGCSDLRAQSDQSKIEAIDVARDYVAKHMPDMSYVLTNDYEAICVDLGTFWGVTFEKPGTHPTGGVPNVYIDKKSLNVVRAEIGM